jgi:hypothetical protein
MRLVGLSCYVDKFIMNSLFNKLKGLYGYDSISQERKDYLEGLIKKYGYLPYPHIRALEELTDAEVLFGIEVKMELAGTLVNGEIYFDRLSPLARHGVESSDWFKTEQHNIKLLNLAALGDGNKSNDTGKFADWLRQLLILPSGRPDGGVFATTIYLTPFHPREFGCAYLPAHNGVSDKIECPQLKEKLGLDVKEQVEIFLATAQLCNHPIIYDVLPQTARFSKLVLCNPHIARWYDIPTLIDAYRDALEEICAQYDDVDDVKRLIRKELKGKYGEVPEALSELKEEIEEKFLAVKKELSNQMTLRANQAVLHERIKKIIQEKAGYPLDKQLAEDDIKNQGEIIGELINQGLWPAPGGAWNSSGVPVFDKMNRGAEYPMFKHFDFEDNDVTHFANLDCQTPYYFVFLENGEINEPVVDIFIHTMKQLQSDYNFDGFRVDHIDHIVDKVSEDENQRPISYRAPRQVLTRLNIEMKQAELYFATLAEYMLWDNYLEEYHNMGFDVLWGQDIVSQHDKTVSGIFKDHSDLAEYNEGRSSRLSILKTYNNQDGEFEAINRYPGQLGKAGALFKWLKFKFIVGGEGAQRPCMYVDGDESFTKVGIERIIGEEVSMRRANESCFYAKFDAIGRFAMNSDILCFGKSTLLDDDNHFVSWITELEGSNEAVMVVANEMPPKQKLVVEDELVLQKGENVYDKVATIPEGYKVAAKYEIQDLDIVEIPYEVPDLTFAKLAPSEFYIYKLVK